MPDSPPPPPPRVAVTLPPGGAQVPGRIHEWRQGADGAWRAEVTITVPAAAVQQVDGEDYTGVPRDPAPTPGPQFVLDNSLPPGKDGRRLVLHITGCAFIGKQKYRPRPMPVTPQQARQELGRGGITTRCDVCKPAP